MIGSTKQLKIVGQGASTRVQLLGDWEDRPLDGVRETCGVERALDKR
jgi:hypothetical protein